MGYSNQFFKALSIREEKGGNLATFAKQSGVPVKKLKYYNKNNIVPTGTDLKNIMSAANISELLLRIKMGRLDKDIIEAIQENAEAILPLIETHVPTIESPMTNCKLEFKTNLGELYRGDSYELLKSIESDSIDLIFADPPFNLAVIYPSEINDSLRTEKYIHWCQEWIKESARVLKPGGSLFLWNLPKWNAALTSYLESMLTFRHWIGVDIKYSLPIQKRLYPSHYSLLYYVKGDKPKTFHPDRLTMDVCSKCYAELKDYGGYKDKMNPTGINMTDIWTDIPPVRHRKYKRREGSNELSLKLLDRIIEMASNKGDLVFDPFGGSGTTYMAAELKGRKWIGCEIGPSDVIQERFSLINDERKILDGYRKNINSLFPEKIRVEREKRGLWTCETIRKKKKANQLDEKS
ncbi:site-specific DNA-methyltransferase [Aliiglaciecola sp. M165]|uniref:site-specific DNA-methyltransferase n=1 Tax=Aliiglaciecola sp. M165 TaxID=2593649 RepID=UPI001180C4C1|nr:site-specific DNA-methyltransferase [Aliiglaciecola sp. M165]TRY31041.1 site-specific DNA-methyltransferase [Aliiglaciecola sp. M165]